MQSTGAGLYMSFKNLSRPDNNNYRYITSVHTLIDTVEFSLYHDFYLVLQLGVPVQEVKRVTIWGNHSSTQYPDIAHATVKGQPVALDEEWVKSVFVPTVQKRGAAVIAARKLSSAMSAAKVIL
jgi:malate/lactate dehydrogenase